VRADWKIETPADADYALSRLALHETQVARIEQEAGERVEVIDRWRRRQRRRHDRRIELYRAKLVEYAHGRLAEQAPGVDLADDGVWKRITKRFSTPNGYVQARRLDAKIELQDSSAVVRRTYAGWWIDAVLDADTAKVVQQALAELAAAGVTVDLKAPMVPLEDVAVADGVVTLDGEIVPCVKFRERQIKFDDPKPERDAEHSVWSLPPDDSQIPVDVEDDDDEDGIE
jgi:hypothetical protein